MERLPVNDRIFEDRISDLHGRVLNPSSQSGSLWGYLLMAATVFYDQRARQDCLCLSFGHDLGTQAQRNSRT